LRINKINFTGIDQTMPMKHIFDLSQEYPFIEWGIATDQDHFNSSIVFAKNRTPGFVSKHYLSHFLDSYLEYVINGKSTLSLSFHLHSMWPERALQGFSTFQSDLDTFIPLFKRIQFYLPREYQELPKKDQELPKKDIANLDKMVLMLKELDLDNQFSISTANSNLVNNNDLLSFVYRGDHFSKTDKENISQDPTLFGIDYNFSAENLEEKLKSLEDFLGDREVWLEIFHAIRNDKDNKIDSNKINCICKLVSNYVTTAHQ